MGILCPAAGGVVFAGAEGLIKAAFRRKMPLKKDLAAGLMLLRVRQTSSA
jgi:hypothetical protein